MRNGETLEQEQARLKAAAELPHRITALTKRVGVMVATVKKLCAEVRDSETHRLKPCACKRQWTRFNQCSLCDSDASAASPK